MSSSYICQHFHTQKMFVGVLGGSRCIFPRMYFKTFIFSYIILIWQCDIEIGSSQFMLSEKLDCPQSYLKSQCFNVLCTTVVWGWEFHPNINYNYTDILIFYNSSTFVLTIYTYPQIYHVQVFLYLSLECYKSTATCCCLAYLCWCNSCVFYSDNVLV